LRERFGDPLLVRAGRGMVRTPRADALKDQVHAAVTQVRAVFTTSDVFDPARVHRTFAISLTDYVMVVYGDHFEGLLRARAPLLDVRYVPNAVDDAERLRRGETDLAIGIYGELPPELRTRPLLTDRFVCVVRDEHPAVGEDLTLEAFAALDHIQIAPRGQPGGYVDDLLAARGLRRRVARAVPFFQVALGMVARSDAILTVSERIALQLGPALGLKVLKPPLPLEPYTLSLVWHPRFDADPAHAWLRETLLEATRDLGAEVERGSRRRLDPSDPTTGHARRTRRNG
jgi:DNA-binding transcriptional LysR family regulator